jgi:predicted PurR-regulated permease PerM
MITLFFLLASGDRLLRGFVEVLPRFKAISPCARREVRDIKGKALG